MRRLVFRAGWPSRLASSRPPRTGRWWVWIGPYVIGDVLSWDEKTRRQDHE